MDDEKGRRLLEAAIAAGDKELLKLFDEPADTTGYMSKNEFLEQLILSRRRARLTQRQLAEQLHMSQPAIARIESGRANLRLSTLLVIADALKVTLHLQQRR